MLLRTVTAFFLAACLLLSELAIAKDYKDYTFRSGDPSLQDFLLPDLPPFPLGNYPNSARVKLGKMLFFDPRLSGDGNMACASCHNPLLGWSDGLPTAKGFKSKVLGRASPTVINTAYNSLQMWDGRKNSLEDQAMGPMEASAEMNMDIPRLFKFLNSNKGYKNAYSEAYPGLKIDSQTTRMAIASFERTIISRDSPFDRWLRGDADAISKHAMEGFKLFMNPQKGNCAVCHSGANFTDNGFHNIGLSSYGKKNPDVGRYAQKPLKILEGAFKTPTLRDIALTSPYFHDGSANTLQEVVDHYAKGGVVKTNLSKNMKKSLLSKKEKQKLIAFLRSLSSKQEPFTLPELPQ
jgi:cytochrome c peroxidase